MANHAEMERQVVINACLRTINNIKTERHQMRTGIIKNIFASQIFWWRYFWRWVSFGLIRRPRRKDAIRTYITANNGLTYKFIVDMHYGRQEMRCERLLNLARATHSRVMWVDEESADACNL